MGPGAPAPPAIEVAAVSVEYDGLRAVSEASLRVPTGKLVALLGPSGSGKTTLLRAIAGFERPASGVVRIAGREVVGPDTWVEPELRRVGMVFQHGALFPHLTVAGNVAFGASERARPEELLERVGLGRRGSSYPHELSGGERQRVALARALAADPAIVLLDEPFAALDPGLRESLRAEVSAILHAAGASALLVTHDQAEALSLADELVVLRDGRVQQVGPPREVYSAPRTRWLAEFLGEADALPGEASGSIVECELGRLPTARELTGAVDVVIRPESVVLERLVTAEEEPGAEVLEHTSFGHDHLTHLRLPSGRSLRSRRLGFGAWAPGERVSVRVDAPVSVFPAGHGPASVAADYEPESALGRAAR